MPCPPENPPWPPPKPPAKPPPPWPPPKPPPKPPPPWPPPPRATTAVGASIKSVPASAMITARYMVTSMRKGVLLACQLVAHARTSNRVIPLLLLQHFTGPAGVGAAHLHAAPQFQRLSWT